MVITVIDIGSFARYPKTGTVGTVIRFQEQLGETFVELDSTGLLYRIDQLIPASKEVKTISGRTGEDLKKLVRDRESLLGSEYDDAVFQQDGACHGGG